MDTIIFYIYQGILLGKYKPFLEWQKYLEFMIGVRNKMKKRTNE